MQTETMKVMSPEENEVRDVLNQVSDLLKERGYDPISQITGYLITNDPAYITSYKDARRIIQRVDRNSLIEVLVRNNLNKVE